MSDHRTPNEDAILRQFGSRLRNIRTKVGLSQEDLAEKAGFSRSYYTEIETGKRNVSLLNLNRLADALNVELTDLLMSQPAQQAAQTRVPVASGFINGSVLEAAGLTAEMVQGGIAYSYRILDAIDQTLLSSNTTRIAKMVELANLSSMLGNISNTAGDSGKTAVINAEGMRSLTVVYCDLDRSPYSRMSRSYREYEKMFASKLSE
jgi:DNA-binding XRE family transcriptional regulator